jgi:hypothetical protein
VLTAKLPLDDHAAMCGKPNRSAWVRNAITEKAALGSHLDNRLLTEGSPSRMSNVEM